MAKYRPLYTKIWKDPDFQELPPEHKLIFIYLCTNELTSESGIYPMTPKTIADETAVSRGCVSKLFENGSIKNVLYDPTNRLIFVRNFHKYNTGGKPGLIKTSIINDCKTYPKTPLWQAFTETYPDFKAEIETVCQRFANGLPTVVAESGATKSQSQLNLNLNVISTKSQSQLNLNKESIEKKDKTPCGEFNNVLLTEAQRSNLNTAFGESGARDRIETLSAYMQSKGKSYKDHYATILTWERMDKKRQEDQGNGNRTGKRAPDGVDRIVVERDEANRRIRESIGKRF